MPSCQLLFLVVVAHVFSTASCVPAGWSCHNRSVFLNEVAQYDHGNDVGIAVEVAGLAGMDLHAWALIFYDNSGKCVRAEDAPHGCLQAALFTKSHSTQVPDSAGGWGLTVIQVEALLKGEGSISSSTAEAVALMDLSGTLSQFISLGRTAVVATEGPAVGETSHVVVPTGTSVHTLLSGESIQLSGTQADKDSESTCSWVKGARSFGALNAGQQLQPVLRTVDLTHRSLWINELYYKSTPVDSESQIELCGAAGTPLMGYILEFYNGGGREGSCGSDTGTGETISGGGNGDDNMNASNGCSSFGRTLPITLSTLPDTATQGSATSSATTCIVVTPPLPLQHGPISGVALLSPSGAVVEFVSWSGIFKASDGGAAGVVSTNILGIHHASFSLGGSLQLRGGPGWYTWLPASTASWGHINAGQYFANLTLNSSTLHVQTVGTPGLKDMMDHLIDSFQTKHHIRVEQVQSFDTYEKMDMGAADMVISHYTQDNGRSSAHRFIMTGQGEWPRFVYSNGAAILGPSHDPANIKGMTDASAALLKISQTPGTKLRVSNTSENIYMVDILRAAGGAALTRDDSWISYVDPPIGADDVHMILASQDAADYVICGTISFLNFKHQQPEFAMDVMVWGDELLHHAMVSIVVRQKAFPRANIHAAKLFQAHLLSAKSQGYIKAFRMPGWKHPVWFPRGVDNARHNIYEPYPGEDPSNDVFVSPLKVPCTGENGEAQDNNETDSAHNLKPLAPMRTHRSVEGVLDLVLYVVAAKLRLLNSNPKLSISMTTRGYATFDLSDHHGSSVPSSASFPGPVLRVKRGDLLRIRLVNDLDDRNQNVGENRTSVNTTNLHLHGMHIPATPYHAASGSCGDNMRCRVPPGEAMIYEYRIPDTHATGTYWYHPHVHATSALQVGGLMAGALIVEDNATETSSQLSQLPELVLVIQMLYFKSIGVETHQTLIAQLNDSDFSKYNGPANNTILINGQLQPTVGIRTDEAQRLRIINGNEVAVFDMIVAGCQVISIAYDGVYMDHPMREDIVVLPPGGRADLVLVCSNAGEFWLESVNNPSLVSVLGSTARIMAKMMKFIVTENSQQVFQRQQSNDYFRPAPSFPPCRGIGGGGCGVDLGLGRLPLRPAYLREDLAHQPLSTSPYDLKMNGELQGNIRVHMLNGVVYSDHVLLPGAKKPEAPRILTLGKVDEFQIWGDSPIGGQAHPFHAHVNHFQVVAYESDPPTNATSAAGLLYRPGQWRDTLIIPGGRGKVRIRFKPIDFCGDMMIHCHTLAHQDRGMMQMLKVVAGPDSKCIAVSGTDNSASSSARIIATNLLIILAIGTGGLIVGVVVGMHFAPKKSRSKMSQKSYVIHQNEDPPVTGGNSLGDEELGNIHMNESRHDQTTS